MAGELMLIGNPRRKRKRGPRKMSALQRQYFGGGRRKRKRRTRVTALASNPRRRRRSRVLGAAPVRRRRRRVSRYRRNPVSMRSFNPRSLINDTIIPASIGAAGALGLDLALGYGNPYLPDFLKSGVGLTAAKLGGAILIGMVAQKTMGKRYGDQVTAGAVTVTMYDLIKSFIRTNVPGLPLSGYNMGWISPALQTGGDLSGMGVYVGSDRSMRGLGGMGMYVGERESDYINTY